jgi:hypothetical protein
VAAVDYIPHSKASIASSGTRGWQSDPVGLRFSF